MDFPQLLVLALVFVVMGIALDSLIRYLMKEADASHKKKTGSPESDADKIPDGFVSEARILRDVGRRVAVQMHGNLYRTVSDLGEEERQHLNKLFNDLSGWLERSRPIPQPAPTPSPKPDLFVGEAPQIQRPSINPVNILMNAVQTDVRSSERSLSLAEQVDTVLQDLLKNSPLKARGIHLTEAPDRSLIVMVGLDKYAGIDAVPDEEIRQLIRSAAEEWRKRSSGRI